jgi:hypothetical protein
MTEADPNKNQGADYQRGAHGDHRYGPGVDGDPRPGCDGRQRMNDAHRDKALLAQNGCEYFARDRAVQPAKDGDQDRGDQSGYHRERPSRVPFTVQPGDEGDQQTEKSRDNSHQPERSPQDHPDIPAGKIPKRRVIAGGTKETPQGHA